MARIRHPEAVNRICWASTRIRGDSLGIHNPNQSGSFVSSRLRDAKKKTRGFHAAIAYFSGLPFSCQFQAFRMIVSRSEY